MVVVGTVAGTVVEIVAPAVWVGTLAGNLVTVLALVALCLETDEDLCLTSLGYFSAVACFLDYFAYFQIEGLNFFSLSFSL